jgi:hypothetical protein
MLTLPDKSYIVDHLFPHDPLLDLDQSLFVKDNHMALLVTGYPVFGVDVVFLGKDKALSEALLLKEFVHNQVKLLLGINLRLTMMVAVVRILLLFLLLLFLFVALVGFCSHLYLLKNL